MERPDDKGGMSGYVAPTKKGGKGKKGKKAPAAKSKADYRSGGMYSTGRAIPPAPGTKKSSAKTPRRSADSYGSGGKKKSTNPFLELTRSLYSYPTTPGVGDSLIAAARSLYSAGNPNFKDGKRVQPARKASGGSGPLYKAKPKGGSGSKKK